MLSGLASREREVICLRFGIGNGGQDHTLEEIGRSVGLTPERVRQVVNKALTKMRKWNAAGKDRSPNDAGKAEFQAVANGCLNST